MSPRETLRERVLRERDRQRRDALSEAARESMARNAFGKSWASSPIDKHSQSLVPDAQPSDTAVTMQGVASPSKIHTVTVEATSGQLLSDAGGPVQWAAGDGDPEGPLGFGTARADLPSATITCDITGVLAVDLEWRWADQGSGDGRFRTVPKVTLERSRQGTTVSRSWEDPQPGPGGDWRHLGLKVQGRDTVQLFLPHTAGSSKGLGPARATFTLWETGPSAGLQTLYALAEEDATGEIWLVTVGTADGAVTKVAQWTSTDEVPDSNSGMDVSGGSGWATMGTPVADPTHRVVEFDLASAAVKTAEPPDSTSDPDWSNANPTGTTVGGGVLWTVATSGGTTTVHKVDMGTGLDDSEFILTPSASNTVSRPGRWLHRDGTLYGSPELDDGNWYLLGFDPSTGAETSRVGLSAVVTVGPPEGLARRSDGTWWLMDLPALRQFDPDDGSLVSSVQVDSGWVVYGMAFS